VSVCVECFFVVSITYITVNVVRIKINIELKNKFLILIFDRLGGAHKGKRGVDVRIV